MSNIDKQALRLTAEKAKDNFMPNFMVPTRDVLALLDELEAAEKRIAEQREYYEGVIADGSRRIAELEAKIETSDKLQDSAFRHGLQHGFSYGQTNDQARYEQCIAAYSPKKIADGIITKVGG
ncbi:TPA: ead/Ea22-like family protein [Escherichia coli]|uniref:ead/Ea22-like family protein n=1 Tax=Enterobacter hormaechei TaxID=158836 RepID=UPI000AAE9BAE|nr:ead/Ea22-like family protein [Enterobacter hormaechei]EFW7028710.1 ead/Ea22-like family protein [Shigella sonnei]EHE8729554.1 ead/Ea22-like family protein [Escherichia coli]VAL16423.1 Uncharacterised protein [Enterobacter hormaechei]HBB8697367.1 ead/Ea22-like family protein [Escherichia coli]HBJ0064336.1 ead/Ea22-like family protein [Escherichia coli]